MVPGLQSMKLSSNYGPGAPKCETVLDSGVLVLGWILGWIMGWIMGWILGGDYGVDYGWILGWIMGWIMGWILRYWWIMDRKLGVESEWIMASVSPVY